MQLLQLARAICVQLVCADACTSKTFGEVNQKTGDVCWQDPKWTPQESDAETTTAIFFDVRYADMVELGAIDGDQWRELESLGVLSRFVVALLESKSVPSAYTIAMVDCGFSDGNCWPAHRKDDNTGDTLALFLHREMLDVTDGVQSVPLALDTAKVAIRRVAEELDALADWIPGEKITSMPVPTDNQPQSLRVMEVNLVDVLPPYADPDACSEWRYIAEEARFKHMGNGSEPGVHEFMVYVGDPNDAPDRFVDAPAELRGIFRQAIDHRFTWILFHQG